MVGGSKGFSGVWYTAAMAEMAAPRASAASGATAAMETASMESAASGVTLAMETVDGNGSRLAAERTAALGTAAARDGGGKGDGGGRKRARAVSGSEGSRMGSFGLS